MMEDNTNIKIYIGSLIVIFLQVFLGPIISINSVVPNMLLSYTIVCIVLRPDKMHLIFAFIMGLVYDLVCSGPVGAMAFVMVVFAFIVQIVLNKFETVNLAVSLFTIAISVFFVELFYGVFQVSILINAGFVDVLAYRILPCTIYDLILAFIMFAIMAKIIAPPATINPENITNNIDNSRW